MDLARVIEGTLIPQTIEESRIVFRYLWPNPYYQTPEEETANQQVRELPPTVNQRLDGLLTHIQSGINLNEIAFSDGNIMF